MKNPLIITIGREYGSGGREIGKALAHRLGISFYDKELITLAADRSGLSKEYIESNEQRSGIMSSLASFAPYTSGFFSAQYLPLSEAIFISQAQIIRDIAASESAVIVGRCADYILAERENTINIFVHAPIATRIQRIMSLYQIDEASAMKDIAASDRERSYHYFRYTDAKWGKAQNYDICINSSLLGIDKSVDLLEAMARISQI